MSEDNLWRILAQPWVMIGSDASVRAPWGPLSHDFPHPRAYGTFPRVLRAALDGKVADMAGVIRRMTSLPASHFRLRGRGEVKPGAFADVTVIDPSRIRDVASYSLPHQLSEGVTHVLVNGTPVLEQGRLTGHRSGRWLE
jgi:N-acyl-D-aspartate/D-glutamate deacylase